MKFKTSTETTNNIVKSVIELFEGNADPITIEMLSDGWFAIRVGSIVHLKGNVLTGVIKTGESP